MLNSCLSAKIIVVIFFFTIVTESLTRHFLIWSNSCVCFRRLPNLNVAIKLMSRRRREKRKTQTTTFIFLFTLTIKRVPTDGGLEARLPGPGLFRLREDVRRDLACPTLFMYNGLDFRVKAVQSRIKTGFTRWNKSTWCSAGPDSLDPSLLLAWTKSKTFWICWLIVLCGAARSTLRQNIFFFPHCGRFTDSVDCNSVDCGC